MILADACSLAHQGWPGVVALGLILAAAVTVTWLMLR